MEFLEPGNFNGLIFRDGMVFVSDIGKWITTEEYLKNMKLTEIEKNVILVALDHMEEHIQELMEERTLRGGMWQERLDACKTIRTKFK